MPLHQTFYTTDLAFPGQDGNRLATLGLNSFTSPHWSATELGSLPGVSSQIDPKASQRLGCASCLLHHRPRCNQLTEPGWVGYGLKCIAAVCRESLLLRTVNSLCKGRRSLWAMGSPRGWGEGGKWGRNEGSASCDLWLPFWGCYLMVFGASVVHLNCKKGKMVSTLFRPWASDEKQILQSILQELSKP